MRKVIYGISVLLITLVLTGCNVDYEAKIKKDKSVSEKIVVKFSRESCAMGDLKPVYTPCKEIVDETLSYMMKKEGYPNYSVKVTEKEKTATAILTYEYKSLEDFKKSKSYNEVFKESEIKGNSFKYLNFKNAEDQNKDAKYNFKLISDKFIKGSNSDKKNVFNGSYEWNFTNKSEKKNINFIISNNNNFIKANPILFICLSVVFLIAITLLIIYFVKNKTKK